MNQVQWNWDLKKNGYTPQLFRKSDINRWIFSSIIKQNREVCGALYIVLKKKIVARDHANVLFTYPLIYWEPRGKVEVFMTPFAISPL